METMEDIIGKYLEDKASAEELIQLNEWYNSFDCSALLYVPGSVQNEVVVRRFSELKLKLGISKNIESA